MSVDQCLKKKAEELAKILDHARYKTTNSYPDGNVDMGLNLRDYMVRKSADAESKEDSKNKRLPKILKKLSADSIYNVNGTGLFYHAVSNDWISGVCF